LPPSSDLILYVKLETVLNTFKKFIYQITRLGNMAQIKKPKKHVINFGKFHDQVHLEGEVKELHELTQEEKNLLVGDFKKLVKLEKEEEGELKAIKHFEKELQQLIENVVYLEGYIQEIENGHSMLKLNTSVKELGNKLDDNIKEVEKLSSSLLIEEKKILGLAKHVRQILSKAKKYHGIIFK
jgi:hypothetical protein